MLLRFFKLLIISISISLIFQDCGTNKVKIGFLMDDFSSERWYKDKELFISKAEELGATVFIDSAMGDIKRQFDQAGEMLKKNIDVLVVVPAHSDLASSIVKLAHAKDIPVISYDRLIQNSDVDYYISFDNTNVGELMAEYLTKREPAGNYVMICGPPTDNNSFFIKYGWTSILQPLIEKGDITVVYDSCVSDWETEEGYRHMNNALKVTRDITAVLCANDALAQGAISALKEAHLEGTVLVSGQDAETDAIRSILAGNQTMTVYKPIEAISFAAANAAIKLAKKEPISEANQYINNGKRMIPSIMLPSMVVNRDNIDMTVIADGYLKEHNLRQ